MARTNWQLLPAEWHEDRVFQEGLLQVHHDIYHQFYDNDPLVNDGLGFHLHGYRRSDNWRITLILTPWMMSRLLFPEHDPHIVIPEGWSGEDRGDSEYQVMGPTLRLGWCGHAMLAHLNYNTQLGHYLLQPFTLKMRPYRSASEVFRIWNTLFNTRTTSMKQSIQKLTPHPVPQPQQMRWTPETPIVEADL
jgi:hypothetical protein